MTFSLNVTSLGVPELGEARRFYATTFPFAVTEAGHVVELDMSGTGQVALLAADALAAGGGGQTVASGFRGYVISYVLEQPAEVEAVLNAAVQGGATVLKPAKKALFAGFSAVLETPDGSIWKLASASTKNKGPVGTPPVPTETGVILGVASPKTSKAFYAALGMTVDRDYGNKYIDFQPAIGSSRLCLMPRNDLAKDAGVAPAGEDFRAIALVHKAGSRADADTIVAAAVSAGGRSIAAPAGAEQAGYAAYFSDPDGFVWRVAAE